MGEMGDRRAGAGAWRPSPRGLVAVGLLLIACVLCRRPLLLGETFYTRDVHLLYWAQWEAFARVVAEGSWPTWNPWASFGQPLLASPEAQILYPPAWLNLVLRPPSYLTVFTLLHLWLGAVGVLVLAQGAGASTAGASVAATVWLLSGPFTSFAMFHHFAAAACLPWVLAATGKLVRTPGLHGAALLGAALAAQVLAGSGDLAALSAAAAGALLLAELPALGREPQRGAARARLLAAGVVAIGLALGLSAPQWLPAVAVVALSNRALQPEWVRSTWSMHPLELLGAWLPDWLAALSRVVPIGPLLSYQREPFLASLYLGALTPALVFWAAAAPARRRVAAIFGVVALVAALVAMGRHAPLFPVLSRVPPLHLLRIPVKVMILATCAWAVLCGLGFDALREARPDARWRRIAAVALGGLGAALLLAAGSWVWCFGVAGSRPLAWAGALLLAGGLAVARTPPRRAAVIISALALLDLGVSAADSLPSAPRELYARRPPILDQLPTDARLYVYDYSLPDNDERHPGRHGGHVLASRPSGWSDRQAMALALQDSLFPPTAGRWGIRSGYEIDRRVLFRRSLNQLVQLLQVTEGTPAQMRLLRLGSITHVVTLHTEGFEDLRPVAILPSFFRESIRLLEVPEPLPRTYVVTGVKIADGTDALRLLVDPSFDPTREVVLPGGVPLAPAGQPGRSRIVEERGDRLLIEAELPEAGYVVLTDTFDEGWSAWVDGREVAVQRANVAFRAVPAPAGLHHVELRYWPPWLGTGLLVALSTLVALAISLSTGYFEVAGPRRP
jgi:hypothetical protein